VGPSVKEFVKCVVGVGGCAHVCVCVCVVCFVYLNNYGLCRYAVQDTVSVLFNY
jgi:hypothetical protein